MDSIRDLEAASRALGWSTSGGVELYSSWIEVKLRLQRELLEQYTTQQSLRILGYLPYLVTVGGDVIAVRKPRVVIYGRGQFDTPAWSKLHLSSSPWAVNILQG